MKKIQIMLLTLTSFISMASPNVGVGNTTTDVGVRRAGTNVDMGSASTNIVMQKGVALEGTQQKILAVQQQILDVNLRALQLQIAEFRNRVNQSASYGGTYTDIAKDVASYRKEIEDINKKLGNNLTTIDKMAENMKKRFGKDATLLTTADMIKDSLKSQKDYLQRMYLRFGQIEKRLEADFKNYNGASYGEKVESANNPVKALQLMAETLGGVQRSIHTLTEVMVEKTLKEQLDRMYMLEQEKQVHAKKIAEKATIEYTSNKYDKKLQTFANKTLTKEELKERDELKKIVENDRKEEMQAAALRLNETGLTQFNDKSTEDNKTLTKDSTGLSAGKTPRKHDNIEDSVRQLHSDKFAIDLGKEHTLFDENGNLKDSEKNSTLTKFYDDGKGILEKGIYSISFADGGSGGFLNDLIEKAKDYITNPEKLKSDLGNMIKNYAKKTLKDANRQMSGFIKEKINEGKSFVRGKINEGKNLVKNEIKKQISTIVDAPKKQLAEIDKYLKSQGINVDLSGFGSGILDTPSNLTNDILNVVDSGYSELSNLALDNMGSFVNDGLSNADNYINDGIDSIFDESGE